MNYLKYLLIFILGFQGNVVSVDSKPKRAIVIGASAGMGRAISKLLAKDYVVGLAARRLSMLQQLQTEIPTPTYIKELDASNPQEAVLALKELIVEMGGIDLLVISISAFHEISPSSRDWLESQAIFDVDIIGFHALAKTGLDAFEKQGYGHLVGFSSIDGLRGIADWPEYSAAKAWASRYMEAERNYFAQHKLPIYITELIPGWINSAEDPDFTKKFPKAYWVDSLDDATFAILEAIKDKKKIAYITKRWEQVSEVIKIMSDDLYNALGGI